MSPEITRRGLTIAIDGPAGAGKSTLAKIVANRLGYLYIDTGAMYRALALKALRTGVDIEDDAALAKMARESSIQFHWLSGSDYSITLDGVDVTADIREPDVNRVVSRVSSAGDLRRHTVGLQREMAAGGGVVMDGRDIGSHVLPDADLKFYVTASLSERALRRQQQLVRAGHALLLKEIEAEIEARDEQDKNKGTSSLIQTPDAILIDTTGRPVSDVVEEILSHCRRG